MGKIFKSKLVWLAVGVALVVILTIVFPGCLKYIVGGFFTILAASLGFPSSGNRDGSSQVAGSPEKRIDSSVKELSGEAKAIQSATGLVGESLERSAVAVGSSEIAAENARGLGAANASQLDKAVDILEGRADEKSVGQN